MATSDGIQAAEELVGVPDGMQRLWTPHRMAYIKGDSKPVDNSEASCPFCRLTALSDDEGLVVARGDTSCVVLNLFPYNSGHVMVVPWRHVADYTEVTQSEMMEIAVLTRKAMRVIRSVMNPAGFNVGMNQGNVAGAGIAGHLHQHIVPRWIGDANFLPVIGQAKAIPEILGDTRLRLATAWNKE